MFKHSEYVFIVCGGEKEETSCYKTVGVVKVMSSE